MSKKIYFLKTHKINITNLVVAQLIKNAGLQCYGPCQYDLDGKFIRTTLGDFAKSQYLITNQEVRYIDWSSNISVLENFSALADNENKFLIFGSHRDDQIDQLKQYYQSDIVTISINYAENMYPFLIKNMAEYHVHLLEHNQIEPLPNDIELLKLNSNNDLVDHYFSEFLNMQLIPISSSNSADHVILVDDLLDKSLMRKHFTAVGLPFTEQSEIFYDQWLNLQYN